MEKIVINGMLYSCKNGTNDSIHEAANYGSTASPMEHENGTAFAEYNKILENITDTHKPTFLDGCWSTF